MDRDNIQTIPEAGSHLRLTDAAREVLACVNFDADVSVAEIARRTRMKMGTAQYQLRFLRDRRVIEPLACIDVHRIGLSYYAIFFSLSPSSSTTSLLNLLTRHPEVAFVSEFAAAYRYGIGIFGNSAHTALATFAALVQKAKVTVTRKSTATRTALYEVPLVGAKLRRYSQAFQISGLVDRVETVTVPEQQLLTLLATTQLDSYREAARKLGIAHTTLAQRLSNLKRRGIFLRRMYSIDAHLLGFLSYKLLIFVKGFNPDFVSQLRSLMLNDASVSHFVEAYGEWDFEANINVREPGQLSSFIEKLFSRFPLEIADIIPLQHLRTYRRQFFPGTP